MVSCKELVLEVQAEVQAETQSFPLPLKSCPRNQQVVLLPLLNLLSHSIVVVYEA